MDSPLESIYGMINDGNICNSIINADFKTIRLHKCKSLKKILGIEESSCASFLILFKAKCFIPYLLVFVAFPPSLV